MKALVLSFENVLCDSHGIKRRAFHAALKENGYFWPLGAEKECERRSTSRLDYALESRIIRREDVDLIEYALSSHEHDMLGEFDLSHRAAETIRRLNEKGVKIAIVSESCAKPVVIQFLKRNDLDDFVDFVTTKTDPDPAYPKTLKKLGLPTDQIVVFDGSEQGQTAAKNAGYEFVKEVSNRNLDQFLESFERNVR